MAKKTASRPKAEPKADAPAAAAPARPRVAAKAPKRTSNKVVASTAADTTSVSEPTEDEIRERAYQLYLERGGGHGMHFEDWLDAKRELRELNTKK